MENKTPNIQVLGSGCPSCKKFFAITEQVVDDLGLGIAVEYVSDIQAIINMGMMGSPVLAVNGKPALVGFTSDVEKIKKAIRDNV